jgi:signal transduction histidine kinase/DNA-binding response OmpR family regulator
VDRRFEEIGRFGTCVMSLPDQSLNWSSFAVEMLGFGDDPPATWTDLVARCDVVDRPVMASLMADLDTSSGTGTAEFRLTVHGASQWFRYYAQSREASDRSAHREVLSVIRDITTSQLAAIEIARAKDRVEAAADAGIVGVWDWDVPNNILWWDTVMYKLYGLRAGDFGGAYEAWAAAIHPEDKERTEGDIAAALRGERAYEPNFRVVWPDGSVHHLKAASRTEYDETGMPLRMIGVNYDLTAEVAILEELAKAKRDAEQASAAKSRFLANVSHEIRTPMNAIIGLSALGLGLPNVPTRLTDYLQRIHTSSKALLSTIDDVLDFSKLEAERLHMESTPFAPRDVCDNAIDLFGLTAFERHVELIVDIAPDIPELVRGDAMRLKQVLNNLIGNAIKFTEVGSVRLSVERQPPAAEPVEAAEGPTAAIRFSVTDTGIGISASEMARLFAPFTQADGTIARRFGGTGLGLVISQRLVALMGGTLEVESTPGVGSRFHFTVTLPVEAPARPLIDIQKLRGQRALVVDDHDSSRLVLANMLASWGVHVTEAASGRRALDLLESAAADPAHAYHIVILDWQMPEPDGVQLARRIVELGARSPQSAVPRVIMVSGFDRERLLRALDDVPTDGILRKPITASPLLETLVGEPPSATRKPFPSDPLRDIYQRAASIHGARVLVVEDIIANQIVVRDMLERMGMLVTVTDSGEGALSLIERQRFDIALMDVQMGGIDGFEATRRIRMLEAARDLPIVATTAAVLDEDRRNADAAGMNDMVAKPIDPNVLLDTLLRWVNRSTRSQIGAPDGPHDTQLPLLEGIDHDDVRSRFGDNPPFFRRLLSQAANESMALMASARASFERGERATTARSLHGLRGLLGSIGARAVHLYATNAESAVRAHTREHAVVHLERLDTALGRLVDTIRSYLAASESAISLPHDESAGPSIDREALRRLLTQLDAHDVTAFDLFDELAPSIQSALDAETYARLRGAVEKVEFKTAGEILRRLGTTP